MKMNLIVDVIGRFLVMSWIWVFILDFVLKIEENRILIGIIILIFMTGQLEEKYQLITITLTYPIVMLNRGIVMVMDTTVNINRTILILWQRYM